MNVKRFDAHTNIDDFKSDWHEDKDGPMVRYSDYALLEEKFKQQQAQISALVAENDINLHGAARELNTSWMMHKTMLGAQAALHCLIQGDIRGTRDWLEGTTDEAFAEIPDDITPADLQKWFDKNMVSGDGGNGFLTYEEALNKLRHRTPLRFRQYPLSGLMVWRCLPVFGKKTAVITTLLLAVKPIDSPHNSARKELTMSKFIVIQQRLWCNESGHGIEYSSDLEEFDTRKEAIKHGFEITESDDFNIGVVDNGRLVSFDWMGKPVGESQETIQEIAEALGLGAVESKGEVQS